MSDVTSGQVNFSIHAHASVWHKRLGTFGGIQEAVQLHGLGKVRLPIAVLIIRRGNDCDLIQIVLKAGEEPASVQKNLWAPFSNVHVGMCRVLMWTKQKTCNYIEGKCLPVQLAGCGIDTSGKGVLVNSCLQDL